MLTRILLAPSKKSPLSVSLSFPVDKKCGENGKGTAYRSCSTWEMVSWMLVGSQVVNDPRMMMTSREP
jgi:hypothetical protein